MAANGIFELLLSQHDDFTDHDLATLADWAAKKVHDGMNSEWRRPYSLLREGADLLLRRRAKSAVQASDKSVKGEPSHASH